MARYTGAVCRQCRREGQKLFLKGERCYSEKCSMNHRAFAPGQHGQLNARKKVSEYGLQLRAKQKAKRYYGLLCLLVAPLLPIKTRIMEKRKEQEAQKKAQEVSSNLAEENAKLGYRDCLSMEAMKQSEVVDHSPLLLSLGLVAGTMSGFFGVGGGIIVSPSLCLFTQMAPKKIMGTSLVVAG